MEGLDARRSRRCARARRAAAREIPDLREACDLVGFSYYSATGIDREGKVGPYPSGARVGPMGNAPWSEGLGIVLHRLHEELPGRPLLVCEHGVGTDDDEWRTDILRESLQIVDDAIADGVDLRGFFHWTGVDNYEWPYGFDVQFGCFTRDREPKGSAELLRDYATAAEPPTGCGRRFRSGCLVTSSQVTWISRHPNASSAAILRGSRFHNKR